MANVTETEATAGDDFRQQFEARKSEATLQILFKVARLTNEHALAKLYARQPGAAIRAAHTALLPHIDLDGTRISVLADRVGITKQAVGQLVDELERIGMCERVADPSDGRAKLVRFTNKGRRGLLEGLELLRSVEAEFSEVIGPRRMQQLHRTLTDMLTVLTQNNA